MDNNAIRRLDDLSVRLDIGRLKRSVRTKVNRDLIFSRLVHNYEPDGSWKRGMTDHRVCRHPFGFIERDGLVAGAIIPNAGQKSRFGAETRATDGLVATFAAVELGEFVPLYGFPRSRSSDRPHKETDCI